MANNLESKIHLISLAFSGGLLLSLAWLPLPFISILSFISLVPLFKLNELYFTEKIFNKKIFLILIIHFSLWNVLTTHWVCTYYFGEGIGVLIYNTILMVLAVVVNRIIASKHKNISLIFTWLSFEYLHQNWDLANPFLTLGNCLGTSIEFIQWYEFTGALGGSLWILAVNLCIFKALGNAQHKKKFWTIVGIGVPIIVSILISNFHVLRNKTESNLEVIVIHPQINNHDKKNNIIKNLDVLLGLTKLNITADTDYVVWPEGALNKLGWIHIINENKYINQVKDFLKDYPQTQIIAGGSFFEICTGEEKQYKNSNYDARTDIHFLAYNAVFKISLADAVKLYTKKKLVPFEETIPFSPIFRVVQSKISKNGLMFSVTDKYDNIFNDSSLHSFTPLVCYESILGEFTAYASRRSNLMFFLMNELSFNHVQARWLGLYNSMIRAIETRKNIARSANYGISAFIDPFGRAYEIEQGSEGTALKGRLTSNSYLTFYSTHGDFIGRVSLIIMVLFFLLNIITRFKEKYMPL